MSRKEQQPVGTQKRIMRAELVDLLIARGRPRESRYIRIKLELWNLTVRLAYFLKRFFDCLGALFFIILLSPLFFITAVLVKLTSAGPVIFTQIRVGKDGRHFKFYKFRSMRVDAEKLREELKQQNESADGVIFKIKRDPRITFVGRFMRKFSIDELPQLFNVLTGDMSLVGPRPPLPSEVAQYTLEQRKRLHIKPGITCIWQISGRSDISFQEQVELDKQYIGSRSFWKDLIILLKTIPAVITGRGAY
ncbi:MAG: exopolysaccharide biosynthesis polyprenyl glycosylphosphotransferase [Victivallaceae bacterium]|nr:exopolysaccharide biosynthesis polyprenyl glycosylphosphotransferase [Victivallaceae bacterium]